MRCFTIVDARVPGRAVGVADGVGAALGDGRQKRLRGKRPVDAGAGAEAISGYATHKRFPS